MPKCLKCYGFFPPGFVEKDLCLFCIKGTERIMYESGSKHITKDELVNEYKAYLGELAHRAKFGDADTINMPEHMDIGSIEKIKKEIIKGV